MAHFSVTENTWIADGVLAALEAKNDAKGYFWKHTNTWVTGANTQPVKAAPADGKSYFCPRLNQWTSGTC